MRLVDRLRFQRTLYKKLVSPMNNEYWDQTYRLAVLEVDAQMMPERISAARKAIAGRLQEIEGNSDHREEREKLEHAVHALKVMTSESEAWE